MKLPLKNTRSIVIIGYCFLVTLAITGVIIIYMEVVKLNRQSTNGSTFKEELIELNNTLTTMYQAEGTANLLAFADNELLKKEYDSLSFRVLDQIESLQKFSSNQDISLNLDSLSELLLNKRNNALKMFQLVKQIDKNIIQELSKKTIVTQKDADRLNNLLAEITQTKEDTIHIIPEKKGFFRRLREVISPEHNDTIIHVTKSSVSESKEIVSPFLTDTIIEFFRQIDKQVQKKNAKIVQDLIAHQHELYIIKELTGLQINKIMQTLEEREYQMKITNLREKNESLRRSTRFVAIVGLSALIFAIIFMSLTLQSLNKSQRLQKSIQEAKKRAEELLISREQLIYTITHDIKAPLSSIIGFLDLMPENTLSQKQQYYVNNMHSSASHILDLVRNLLDFHSLEKEQLQVATVAFFPASLIHNIYESFLPLAQKKGLIFELNSSLPDTANFYSDPYYIRQIMNNLISNAVKFTPEQGQISLITSLEEHNRWKISVQDTGPGIEQADRIKIFEEFIRLDKAKKDMEGSGLGLPISKKLAALLGGTIEIESPKESGSIFTLTVPLNPVMETVIPQVNKSDNVSSGKILFVDDDHVQLNLLSELMKKEKLPYMCCSNAYEALAILRTESFHIIFTDIHIPGMEGFELVNRIRVLNFPQAATIPIIAFSADCQKPYSELKANGFNDFLLKPFTASQLLAVIEKHTSFKRKTNETHQIKEECGWKKIIDFVTDDREAAIKIIDSFIEESNKDRQLLKFAFQRKDNEAIRQISHKMLTLMRMVFAQEIVSILTDFEKGAISKEKKVVLFHLLEEKITEAETVSQRMKGKVIMNYELI